MATRKRRAELTNPGEGPPEINFSDSSVPLDADEHLLQIPGCQRRLISLTGKAFERSLLAKLDWFTYMYVSLPCFAYFISPVSVLIDDNRKVLAWALSGYRSDAVKLIGEQVMQPRGLIGLAQDTLDASTAEMHAVFEVLARDDAYAVLIHCTQGKDRSGLLILMMLLLAGEAVPLAAIEDDYRRSELELIAEHEERMREIRALGLGEDYTRCPRGFVKAISQYLQDKYGGVKGYLAGIGIDEEMQEHIRQKLLIQ